MEAEFHQRKQFVESAFHYPMNGSLCESLGMEPKEIVAANLRALMDYARDTGRVELATQLGVEKASGITRTTIRGMVRGTQNTKIDVLQAVAEAFDIQAWTLLVPHLDPSNPPTKPMTKTEIQLYRRLDKVAREYDKLQKELGEADSSGPTRPDNHEPSTGGGGTGGRTKGRRE